MWIFTRNCGNHRCIISWITVRIILKSRADGITQGSVFSPYISFSSSVSSMVFKCTFPGFHCPLLGYWMFGIKMAWSIVHDSCVFLILSSYPHLVWRVVLRNRTQATSYTHQKWHCSVVRICLRVFSFFLSFLWTQAHLRASRKRVIFATQDTRHEIYRPSLAGVARERSPQQKWKFPRPGPLVCWVDHRKTMSVSRQPLHGAWSHIHTGESFSHGKNSLNIHEQSKRWQTTSICVWSFGNTQSERESKRDGWSMKVRPDRTLVWHTDSQNNYTFQCLEHNRQHIMNVPLRLRDILCNTRAADDCLCSALRHRISSAVCCAQSLGGTHAMSSILGLKSPTQKLLSA